ncbi:IPT/TIG domain-containing protein [Thermovorax subterraneus]|nr:IPT/TIG domain-containing protein [Thermovorax subterraneus]
MLSKRKEAFSILALISATVLAALQFFPLTVAFAAVPVINEINPSQGPTAGGYEVTISGQNFAPVGQVEVLFGGVKAQVVSSDGSTIVAIAPPYPEAGTVSITVRNSSGEEAIKTNAFQYIKSSPKIEKVEPLVGTAGTEITITGSGFMKDIDSNHKLNVLIGGTLSTKVTYVSPSIIKAVIPPTFSGYKEIKVENPDGGSDVYFPSDDSQKFFYQKSTPTISSIDPVKGPVNTATTITIKGTNFVPGYYPNTSTPITTVTIGGQPATDVQVIDDKTIVAKTPTNISITGPQHVVVTVDGVSAIKQNGFTFISNPKINLLTDSPPGVSPYMGSVLGGYKVTINGSGFMTGAQVKFAGVQAKDVEVRSDSVITVTVPSTTMPGPVSVSVINPDGGSAVLENGFTYTQSTPRINAVSTTLDFTGPAEGSVLGGETIYIKGTDFGADGYPNDIKVYIGNNLATVLWLQKGASEDIMSVKTPPSSTAGLTTLKVVNKDGGSDTANFTYTRSEPVINRLDVNSATTVSQGTITIEGSDFMAGARVYFGSLEAKDVIVSPDGTWIKATIPEASAAGVVDIRVVNPDQGEAVLRGSFTFLQSRPEIQVIMNIDLKTLIGEEKNTGSTAGGTPIRLVGKDFSNAVQVTIGGKAATNVKVIKESPDRHVIEATAPPNEVGIKQVVVKNPDGSTATGEFQYVVAPTITGVTPDKGSTEGGDIVVISGTGFAQNIRVFLGGAEAEVQEATSTSIKVKTPRNSEGPKDVTVINLSDYGSFVKKSGFTYVLPPSNPVIENIEPTSGSTAGGTEIKVVGTDIRSGARLYIDKNEATVTEIKVEMINGEYKSVLKAITPPGTAGEKPVKVVNPDGKEAISPKPFTYKIPEKALSITSITPNKGSVQGGTAVTVKGANFVKTTDILGEDGRTYSRETRLTIGGNPATEVVVKDDLSTLTAITPGGSVGAQDVIVKVVKVDKQTGEEVEIESQAVLKGGFIYELPKSQPVIEKVVVYNPRTGMEEQPIGPVGGGSIVRIYGEDFIAQLAGKPIEVYFGKNKASMVDVVDAGLIIAITPSSTQVGAVDVKVVNPDGGEAILWGGFVYKSNVMVITSITPNSASVSGMIPATITGANFTVGTKVTIGGEAAYNVNVEDSTKITLIVPPNTPGIKDVVVYNDYGSVTLKGGFQYYVEQSRPRIDSISPEQGSAAGGESITITGENFMSGARVLIGGKEASGVTVKNPGEINALTPPGYPGIHDVAVINPDGGTAVLRECFRYISSPVIETVTPSRGPVQGGVFVEIKGKNFESEARVYLVKESTGQAVELENVKVVSESLIKAIIPASPDGTTGYADIKVENSDGGSFVLKRGFLYKTTSTAPVIHTITPNRGPVQGGTDITIKGVQFEKDALVVIGDSFATGVKVIDSTTITAKTPAGKEGYADVQVINASDGAFAVKPGSFLYTVPRSSPTITAVEPAMGSSEGGTPVTIKGTDFREGITVIIDGIEVPKDDVNLISPTEIRIVTPRAASYGKKDVTVVNEDGGSFTLKGGFEYLPPATIPVISDIDPKYGTIYGGTIVKITGQKFSKGAKVYFGGVESRQVTVDDTGTLATVITPEYTTGSADEMVNGRYPVRVVLVNPDGGLATYGGYFEYTVPETKPRITGIAPSKGPAYGGNLATIEGLDFRPGLRVFFGTSEAKVEKLEDDQGRTADVEGFVSGVKVTVTVPPGTPGKVDVRVANPDGAIALLKSGYEYLNITGQIHLESIDPTEGAISGGTPFTIKGKGFVNPVKVYFGGEEAVGVVAVSPDTITGRTPSNTPGKKDVVVLNGNGLSAAMRDAFEYKVPAKYPRISQVNPNRGPAYGGITVEIYGQNFQNNVKVYIGENQAQVTSVETNKITIILPPGDLGPKDVIVINPDTGLDVLEEGFTYVTYPKIEKVEPKEGPVEGGTEVTITGEYFAPNAQVFIGGKAAQEVKVIDERTIKAKTPPHSAGYKDVTVINPDGGQATLKDGFYYKPPRTKPDTPEDFTARRIDETAVLLTWSEALNANYYEIYGATSSKGPFKYIDRTTGTSYIVTGLDPDTRYYFRVRAANELGFSDYTYADYAITEEGTKEKLIELPADIIIDAKGTYATLTVKDLDYLKKEDYRVVVKSPKGSYKRYKAVLPYGVMQKVSSLSFVFDDISINISPSSLYVPAFSGLSSAEKDDAALVIDVTRAEGAKLDELMKFKEKNMMQLSDLVLVEMSSKVGKKVQKLSSFNARLYIEIKSGISYPSAVTSFGLYWYNPDFRKWEISGQYIYQPGWYGAFGKRE